MTKSILRRLLFNAGMSFSTGFKAPSFDTIAIWINGPVSIYHWRCFSAWWQNPFFDGCFSMLVCVFPLALRRFRLIPFRSDSMVLFLYHWRCFSAWWQNPFFDGCFSMLVWVFPLALRRLRLIPFRSELMVLFIYHWRCFSAWWQNPFFDGCFSMLVWVFPLALRRFRLIPFRSDSMVLFLSLKVFFRMMTKSILWRLLFNAGLSFSTGFEVPSFDTISIWINGPVSIYHWRCFSAWMTKSILWRLIFNAGLSFSTGFEVPSFDTISIWINGPVSIYHWRCFSAWMTKSILWRLIFNAGLSFSTGFEVPSFDTISIWINGPVSIYHWRCFSAWWQNPFFDGCFSMLVWVFPLALRCLRLIPFRSELMVLFLSIIEDAFPHEWQNPFFDGWFSMLVWVFPLALGRFRLIPFRSDLMILFRSIIEDGFPCRIICVSTRCHAGVHVHGEQVEHRDQSCFPRFHNVEIIFASTGWFPYRWCFSTSTCWRVTLCNWTHPCSSLGINVWSLSSSASSSGYWLSRHPATCLFPLSL